MKIKNVDEFVALVASGGAPSGLVFREPFDKAGLKAIANALQSGKAPLGLTLNFQSNFLGTGITFITDMLASGRAPSDLTLDFTGETHSSVTAIINALQSGKAPSGLVLVLGQCYLDQNMAMTIANALQSGNVPNGLTLKLGDSFSCVDDIATIIKALKCDNIPKGLILELSCLRYSDSQFATIINTIKTLPLYKRYQLHIKEENKKRQLQLDTLCYFEPLVWPGFIFFYGWSAAPHNSLLGKLPLEVARLVLSYILGGDCDRRKKCLKDIETAGFYLTEKAQYGSSNYLSCPVRAHSICSRSLLGRALYFRGHLATVEVLKDEEYQSVSADIKKLVCWQIKVAMAKTLNEYNAIWKCPNEEKTNRASFCRLSQLLEAIRQGNKSLEDIVDDIIQFFQKDAGRWYAGRKAMQSEAYVPNNGPSIKFLLMKNVLTMRFFDREVTDDSTLTLITQTELKDSGLQYTLDLTQDNFGGCHIPGLIRFFENEFRRVAGLRKPEVEEQQKKYLC